MFRPALFFVFPLICCSQMLSNLNISPQFYRQPQNPPSPKNALPTSFSQYPQQFNVEDSLDAGAAQNYLSNVPFLEQETEDCRPLPNGTNNSPFVYQCEEDDGNTFVVHNAAVTNYTGDVRYPVDFTSPVRIFLDITSKINRRFDNLGVDVSLYKRSTGWFGCGWLFIPSFSLLSNGDMCYENPSCPLAPGRQVLEIQIEPERLFTRFFKMFHNDMHAYQLVLRIRDNSRPFNDLFCTTIQTRIAL